MGPPLVPGTPRQVAGLPMAGYCKDYRYEVSNSTSYKISCYAVQNWWIGNDELKWSEGKCVIVTVKWRGLLRCDYELHDGRGGFWAAVV